MNKISLLICSIICCITSSHAQILWQASPLKFGDDTYYSARMYYDSAHSESYIFNGFTSVNDTSCNVVKIDVNGYHLMPHLPGYFIDCAINYHNTLYVGADSGLFVWNNTGWIHLDSTKSYHSFLIYQDKLLCAATTNNLPLHTTLSLWDGNTMQPNIYGIDSLLLYAIHSMVDYKGQLYIGGNFNYPGADSINEIARYDGTKWKNVGGQIKGDALSDVSKLLAWKDTLFVCGAFKDSTGAPGNAIAKWDGQQWHKMGSGLTAINPSAKDMIVFNNELYVVGMFNYVNGIHLPSNGAIGKWDGEKWCTLGTLTDLFIDFIGRTKDSLFITGNFTYINGDTITHMAKWTGGNYTDSCAFPAATTAINNMAAFDVPPLLYPNPIEDENLFIQLNELPHTPIILALYDICGNLILSKQMVANTTTINLKVNHHGWIFTKIYYNDKYYTQKLFSD